MTADINKEINELTNEWYNLVSDGHHKDRDCHWYIETVWSYGESPDYYVRHHGYVTDEIEIACDTYETALQELKKVIERAIQRERETPPINNW